MRPRSLRQKIKQSESMPASWFPLCRKPLLLAAAVRRSGEAFISMREMM
jgi:hypothetical protein